MTMVVGEKSGKISSYQSRLNALLVVAIVGIALDNFNLIATNISPPRPRQAELTSTKRNASTTSNSTTMKRTLADDILQNLHLAMVGDSIMRYQYLSLLYYIHTGTWENDTHKPSLAAEIEFESWNYFYNYTNSIFEGREGCDCFREQGRFVPGEIFENRYYRTDDHTTSVAYVCRFGEIPAHGHASVDTIRSAQLSMQYEPPAWEEPTWPGLLENFISKLDPKPEFFIFNQGLWLDHDLTNEDVFIAIRKTLDELGITGIYKTTTRVRYDRHEAMSAHDVFGCQHIQYCLNMSWTGSLDESEYWDDLHFYTDVNRRSNEALFDLLRTIRRQQQQRSSMS